MYISTRLAIDQGKCFMKKREIWYWIFLSVIVIILLLSVILLFIMYRNDYFYHKKVRSTKVNLMFSRRSIRLFAKQNGRFPNSLVELNEYGKKFPDEINWLFPPSESISKSSPNYSEHSVLDGTGGLYYNPENGELKVNLTKPMKYYWRFYFGKEKDKIPSNW